MFCKTNPIKTYAFLTCLDTNRHLVIIIVITRCFFYGFMVVLISIRDFVKGYLFNTKEEGIKNEKSFIAYYWWNYSIKEW